MSALSGTCHCGAIRIEVPFIPERATDCNCSLCRRLGALWAYYEVGTVHVEGHPEKTSEYIWGDKTLRTVRCATCGCVTHWEPLDSAFNGRHGVNIRNFDVKLLESVAIRRSMVRTPGSFWTERDQGTGDNYQSHRPLAMFILIMGVTGSGKTTVGKLLSASLGWPFFDADDFHSAQNVRKMAAGVPLNDEDRRPWLKELHRLISQRTDSGDSGVLACSALKQEYRAMLCSGNPVEVVYLKAERELIRSRLQRRRGHYMPPELIESQFRDLEEPQSALVVDAAMPTDQAVAIVRSCFGD